jgi:hypothetical protein
LVEDELLTAKELAAELKLSLQTLERWWATGPDPQPAHGLLTRLADTGRNSAEQPPVGKRRR